MEERTHVRYSALSMQDDHRDRPLKGRPTSAHEDLRYRFELHEDVPWKSIALALFLLAFGSLFLVISHFIYTEHMGGDSSQAYGFLVLGVLLFLPGKQIILMLMLMLLASCFCFSDLSLLYWSARDSRFCLHSHSIVFCSLRNSNKHWRSRFLGCIALWLRRSWRYRSTGNCLCISDLAAASV
jgi:hypothetical protein